MRWLSNTCEVLYHMLKYSRLTTTLEMLYAVRMQCAFFIFTFSKFLLLSSASMCFALLSSDMLQKSEVKQNNVALNTLLLYFSFACFASMSYGLISFSLLYSALLQQSKATLHVTPCCFLRHFALLALL